MSLVNRFSLHLFNYILTKLHFTYISDPFLNHEQPSLRESVLPNEVFQTSEESVEVGRIPGDRVSSPALGRVFICVWGGVARGFGS